MARIFITGSSDGIGQAGAKMLAEQGHKVYLHARNAERAQQAHDAVPQAEGVIIGDLTTIDGTKALAAEANKSGPFDAIVHNAGLGPGSKNTKTPDGFQATFAVNSLAPYILTALMDRPKRVLYLSSSLHYSGSDDLRDVAWSKRAFQSGAAYNDSKLHDTMLAHAVARLWPDVQSCALDPGWIRTKMGGGGAPGRVTTPGKAIAEYAAGASSVVGDRSGAYFDTSAVKAPHKAAMDTAKQDELIRVLERLSHVPFPK